MLYFRKNWWILVYIGGVRWDIMFWIFDVFFYRCYVLEIIDGFEVIGGVKWDIILCNFLVWIIIFIVLFKGIKILGKVWYIDIRKWESW